DVRRHPRRQPAFPLPRRWSVVPDGVLLVISDRLLDLPSKLGQVELLVTEERLTPRVRDRNAGLLSADALGLELPTADRLELGKREPEPVAVRPSVVGASLAALVEDRRRGHRVVNRPAGRNRPSRCERDSFTGRSPLQVDWPGPLTFRPGGPGSSSRSSEARSWFRVRRAGTRGVRRSGSPIRQRPTCRPACVARSVRAGG